MEKKKNKKAIVRKTPDWGRFVLLMILIAVATYLIFGFIRQQIDLNKLEQERQVLQNQMQEEEKNLKKIEKTLEQTETPAFIEKQARETLGMVKPGETIYVDLSKQE